MNILFTIFPLFFSSIALSTQMDEWNLYRHQPTEIDLTEVPWPNEPHASFDLDFNNSTIGNFMEWLTTEDIGEQPKIEEEEIKQEPPEEARLSPRLHLLMLVHRSQQEASRK